jgi:hypothetical protein
LLFQLQRREMEHWMSALQKRANGKEPFTSQFRRRG